ncbi:putative F-box protein [Senna tora]|uniref:Putative F-box protein n=1 Tax=Senna tora TaxID=362788 RepID=A0A834SVG6_9FABA|nr:putative F-box protein [Senna tora]
MACETPATQTTTAEEGGAATISALHPDIIQTHILTRLDGPALAAAAASSSQLYALSSQQHLWTTLCHATWPSTRSPRIRHVISGIFPHASRSFFSDSFTIPRPTPTTVTRQIMNLDRTPELISAVDLHYRHKLILSRVVETETVSGWFRCSPFRVDILEPKESVQTPMRYPEDDSACGEMGEDLRLSWIVLDPRGGRAMNVSSEKAVSVERHWLSGEVQVKFAAVVGGERGTASELALCSVGVTCVGVEGGGMEVREGWLEMEDMDGMHLNGRESLGILQRALEGKRENKKERGRERERWGEFGKRKRERKERMKRAEGRLDMLCVSLAALSFAGLFYVCVLCR